MEKKIPKYIDRLLKQRTRHLEKAIVCSIKVSKYAEKIGVNVFDPYNEGAFYSDFKLLCEVGHCYDSTKSAIEKALNKGA